MARRHGTSGYTGGCRCEVCKAAKRQSLRARTRMRAYGRPTTDLVDAEPTRAHLRHLLTGGATLDQIATEAGVSYGVISRILYQGQKRVKANSATAILNLREVDTSASRAPVDAAGTRRRIQALAVLGWPVTWQARQVGVHEIEYGEISRGRHRRVAASTAAKTRALYDQYWDVTPPVSQPSSLARNRAAGKGWLPPLAWDEDLLDLPDADLQAEIDRRVAAMDIAELGRCYRAAREEGDRSPLIVAAADAYPRRRRAARAARVAA